MAKKVAEERRKRSDIIGDFLKLMEECTAKYQFNYDEVHEKELLATDIEHKLELQDLSYHQFAKLGKELQQCQKERRVYKDEAEELEPLKKWMEENKSMFNSITKLKGEVKKQEDKHATRGYVPRVMTNEEWSGLK